MTDLTTAHCEWTNIQTKWNGPA